MKKLLALTSLSLLLLFPSVAKASMAGSGNIGFADSQQLYDPENPGVVVEPEDGMLTNNGLLRFDYVPQLDFRIRASMKEDDTYYATAINFKGDTSARAHFLQITDRRGDKAGWTLTVQQNHQFRTADGEELDGASLSLGQSWLNSATDLAKSPILTNETINMTIGETQEVATADQTQGGGVWSLSFGGSVDNPAGIGDTLSPIMDANGSPVMSPTLAKPLYENSAVQLSVPGRTQKIAGVAYTTELTWTLAELP